MKRIFLLISVAVMVLVWTLVGGVQKSLAQETIELRVQTAYAKSHYTTAFTEYLMDLLKNRSNGRFKFKYYPGVSLMNVTAAFDGVRDGVLDMAISAAAYAIDRTGIVGKTQWTPNNWTYEGWMKHSRDKGSYYDWTRPYVDKLGLKILSMPSSYQNLQFSRLPTTKIEDLKGQRWRSMGVLDRWQKCLGVTPLPIKAAEFYEAVQRGVLDGGIAAISAYVSEKWYEIAPNLVFSKIGWTSNMQLLMNLDRYNGLPPDMRGMLDKAIIDSEDYLYNMINKKGWDNDWAIVKKNPRQKVWVVSDQDNEKLVEMSKPFFDELAKECGPADWNAYMDMKKHME